MKKLIVCMLLILTQASCSSVTSTQLSGNEESSEGLTYFLPNKDFIVRVVVTNKEISSIAVETTAAYPDLSKQYVLNHDMNLLGKNTLKVGVNEKGLLSTSTSETKSGISEALKSVAGIAGAIRPLSFGIILPPSGTSTIKCVDDGTDTFVIPLPKDCAAETCSSIPVCEDKNANTIMLSIGKIVGAENGGNTLVAANMDESTAYSGIFYRQNQPYLLKVEGASLNISSIEYSPSNSPTLFLPVSKTFFSDNKADFAFTDGMPTKYDQETEGEIVAALKLPADVIAAYFTAVGQIFSSFKAADSAEAEAINAKLQLEMTNQKLKACLAAIKLDDNDPKKKETLTALGCGN